MSRSVKLVLYIVCIAGTCVFGSFFLKNYKDATTTAETKKESIENAASTTATDVADVSTRGFSRMVTWGLTLLLPILGLAVLIAHDVSHYFGSRAEQALFKEDGIPIDPEYEEAEELWKDGHHLDAIQA